MQEKLLANLGNERASDRAADTWDDSSSHWMNPRGSVFIQGTTSASATFHRPLLNPVSTMNGNSETKTATG